MNRRIVVVTFAMVASVFATQSILASPLALHVPVHASFSKPSKSSMVTVNFRNDSSAPMTIKAGDSDVLLEPGKLTPVCLAIGAKIVANAATANYPAGTVIAVVDANLDKAILTFK
jgi:hypothetical protein